MANLATINDNILADSGIDPINLIVGTGTVNYIPKFTAEGSIGNSIMTESGANILISSNIVLHAGNYNNYAPTLTGGGASGTWGINISGNAAYATSAGNADTVDGLHASAFALTGGSNATGTWPISITGSASSATAASTANLVIGTSGGAIQAWDIRRIAPSNMTAGRLGFGFTSWNNDFNSPWADYLHLRSYTDGSGGNDNLVMFLKNGIGMRIYQQAWGSSAPYVTYVDMLDSGNFNTWAPTLTGGGASGTWGISITGNADTLDGYHASAFALASSLSNYLPLAGGNMTGSIGMGGGTNIAFTGGSHAIYGNNTGYLHFYGYTSVYYDNLIVARGGITNDTGDVTISDSLAVDGNIYFLNSGRYLNVGQQNKIVFSYQTLSTVDAGADRGGWMWNAYYDWNASAYKFMNSNPQGASMLRITNDVLYYHIKNGPATSDTPFNWDAQYVVLHSGNYNSYAPTLTGGGASGTWGINITGNAATVTNGVYTSRTLTINGVTYDLSANRSWTIAAGVTSIIAGTGIEVDQAQGDVRVSNTGVLSVNGSTGDITGIATTAQLAGYLPLAGGTMSGSIAMNGNNINSVGSLVNANGRIILYGNLHIDAFNGNSIYLQYYNQGVTTYIYGDIDLRGYNTTNVNIGYANNSFRAPIFYDSNDTTFYVDPNSLSNLYTLRVGNGAEVPGLIGMGAGFLYGMGVSGAYTAVHAHPSANGVALGSYDGGTFTRKFYVNHDGNAYAITGMYAPVFYDLNDTSYYINPNGTSIVNTISGVNMRVSNAYYWGSGNVYMNYNGTTLNTNVAITSDTYMSAPLYYDSDNGAYYGNFAGTSRFNITQINSVVDQNYYRITNPEGGISANNGPLTGAIKIKLPPAASFINVMMSLTVQIYNYQTGTSRTIRCGGYNYFDGTWYNVFAYQIGDNGTDTLNVRFGVDGSSNCIWIGETSTYWSYPNVFITDIQAGHSQSSFMAYGWSVSFVNAFDTIQTNREAYYQINAGNIASQSVSYASSAGNANTLDGYDSTYFASAASLSNYVPTSRTLTINGVTYDLSANRSWTIASGGVNSIIAGTGISVDQPQGDVRISNTGVLSVNGSTGDITGIATTAQLAGYLPLTGGTLTGQLTISSTNQNFQNLFIKNNTTASSMPTHLYQRFIARYNNDVNGTDVFHWIRDSWEYNITNNYSDVTIGAYNNGTQYGVHFRVGTDGQVYATNSFRAPIFYDSNDTNYYGNFAGVSRLSGLGVGESYYNHAYPGIIQSGSTGYNYDWYNGSWSSSVTVGYLANCSDVWEFAVHDSGHRVASVFYFQGGGVNKILMGRDLGWGSTYVEAQSSFRAPIFYDSNDTSYYLDPNSSSNLYAVVARSYQGNGNIDGTGSASYHPSGFYSTATSWLYGTLYMNGNNMRSIGGIVQNDIMGRPNVQWGAGGSTTGAVIIKFPGGTGNYGMVHAVIDIYEYNGNNVSTVIVGGHNWGSQWYSYGANVVGYTNKQVRVGVKDGKYCIIIGDGSSSWSYGQVVLRKIQNGSYYSGVMDVGAGYTIGIESDDYSWVSGDLRTFRSSGNIYMNEALVATQSWVSSQGYVTGGPFLPLSGGTVTGTTNFSAGVNFASQTNWFGGYGPGSGPGIALENISTFARFAFWGLDFYDWNHGIQMTIDNGYVSAANSFRAPIFYDSNDTTYYLDPNSTSNLWDMRLLNGKWYTVNNNSGNSVDIYVRPNADNTYVWRHIYGGSGTGYGTGPGGYGIYNQTLGGDYSAIFSSSGFVTFPYSVRSPIFYDSQDTAYYLDPNSGSNLYSIITVETRARKNQSDNNYTTAALWTESYGGTTTGIAFHISGVVGKFLEMRTNGVLYWDNSQIVTNNGGTWAINISGNAATVGGLTPPQFFNNMGNAHGTYTDFNSVGNFGVRYLQGNTNGPSTGATQYYGFTLGLGDQYPYGTYATQFYWNRTATGGNPYVSVRFQEGGGWGPWSKIYAGYADSAGNADTVDGYHESAFMRYYGYSTSGNFQTLQAIPGRLRFDQVGEIQNWSNAPSGIYTYGGVLSYRGDNFGLQIYASHTGGMVYKTQWNDDQYSGWLRILDSQNYNSYSPTLTGGNASGTWGISITGNSNYASTSNYANSSGTAQGLSIVGYGNGTQTFYQTPGTFAGYSGWASYLVSNHGDGATYYNQTIIMPFWGAPQYSRLEGGTFRGPWIFVTTENSPYAYNMNQYVRTTDSPTFTAAISVNADGSTGYVASRIWLYSHNNYRGAGTYMSGTDSTWFAGTPYTNFDGVYMISRRGAAGAPDAADPSYRLWQVSSSGNTYQTGSATATGFFEISDARLKTIVDEDYRVDSIVAIKPKFYQKNGKFEVGYIAQEVEGVYAHAVTLGSDGYLGLSYSQVHTLKIAALEDSVDDIKKKIKELEEKLNTLY